MINRDRDRLDVLVSNGLQRCPLTQFRERVISPSSPSFRRSISVVHALPAPAAKHALFRRTVPFFLELVPLRTKALDLRQHPLEQKLSRRSRYSFAKFPLLLDPSQSTAGRRTDSRKFLPLRVCSMEMAEADRPHWEQVCSGGRVRCRRSSDCGMWWEHMRRRPFFQRAFTIFR